MRRLRFKILWKRRAEALEHSRDRRGCVHVPGWLVVDVLDVDTGKEAGDAEVRGFVQYDPFELAACCLASLEMSAPQVDVFEPAGLKIDALQSRGAGAHVPE